MRKHASGEMSDTRYDSYNGEEGGRGRREEEGGTEGRRERGSREERRSGAGERRAGESGERAGGRTKAIGEQVKRTKTMSHVSELPLRKTFDGIKNSV